MKIQGIDHLTSEEIEAGVAAGGRFVFFEYCLSLPFVTWRRASDIYWLPKGSWAWFRALPYLLVSALFGCWAVPCLLVYAGAWLLAKQDPDVPLAEFSAYFVDRSYIMLFVLVSWWGVPWGLLGSVSAILTGIGGGRDVTGQVREQFRAVSEQR